jgi:DNA polymerase-3 subunit epsilon
MALELDRDIVFLDFEATGTDPARDRIVSLAMIRVSPNGSRRSLEEYVNPEMPIPPEAIAIHHITDAMVRDKPRFRDVAGKVQEFLTNADIGGFGVMRYDVPLLTAEFRRAGVWFDPSDRRIVDALTVYHRMEPRNLTAAYRFYCGKSLEVAHDAMADTQDALEVFFAQVDHYQGKSDRPDLPKDIAGLSEFCAAGDPKNVDSRGKFVWRYGSVAFNFGKYQTKMLEDVLRSDRSYVEWLAFSSNSGDEVSDICRQALEGRIPKKPV